MILPKDYDEFKNEYNNLSDEQKKKFDEITMEL